MQTANIGASIIEAQHVKRMTTVDLAKQLNESRQAVYYTRRQKSASIHKVQQLAEIFGYTVEVGGKIEVLRGQTFSDTVDPEWGRQSEFRNRMGDNGTKK